MAKKERDDAKIAMEVLIKALDAPNATYAPGVEVARLDAAEAILQHARETKERDAAIDFLRRAVDGQVSSIGAGGRTRAARLMLAHARAVTP